MEYSIEKAAVVGAGIMGAGIAALLANVGIPVYLLDIVPPDARDSSDRAARNAIARAGLDRAIKAKPASAFFTDRAASLVTIGNTEDDFEKLGEADWIIEAIVERVDIKRDLFARIERVRKPTAIVSSNTSGLPAHMLLEGRSSDFRQHFLITHFFNPVRFMKLLELVPAPETARALMEFMGAFCTDRLGKGVVFCKDRPNFIGNRIGTYAGMAAIHHVLDEGYKFEEADAILGPAMGRPRSAVFRLLDMVGLDTFVHVADNLYENLPDDPQRETFRLPDLLRDMMKRGWLGDKTGQGFYKRVPGEKGGRSVILVLDPTTMEYRPQDSVHFSSLDSVRENPDVFERVKTVVNASDRAGKLAWELTGDMLLYSAAVAEEIANDIVNIDNAMRWGFNWDVGPFQTWDALGVEHLAQKLAAEGRELPSLISQVLSTSEKRFYLDQPERRYFDFTSNTYKPVPETGPQVSLVLLKKAGKEVKANRSASLIDLGDGVLGVEFHAKMNAIDEDIITMLGAAVEEGKKNWRAIVIGNEAPDFSAGANLAMVLMASRMRMWPMLEKSMKGLQQAHLGLKYSEVPVVVAPAGRTLGGGAEIVMHGQKVRAGVETYIGLVEVGAGVIPAGGGCKEMLARWQTMTREQGPFPPSRHAFEIIAVATVATSAYDAQKYGFIRKSDAITLDRDRLLADAKADALALANAKERGEWKPPEPPIFHLAGEGGRLVLQQVVDGLVAQGKATEHDAVVSGKLAWVLTGGNCSPVDTLTEQDILDLEREAFLSLCGMPKTQERMEALLKTGKPLRN